ncbi:hypothetical protein R77567_01636 [Ralstonia sp. LMG 32965]|uniref:Ribosome modulation factor n=1 Tax=Ralstonia flatus TaxID=3058601 RepID=A0AAD2F4K9_9RALS|nr:hypothetical protein [Ralstonia pickettii]CAJ0862307.1 hypothetical protein R77567_01636 [Ralstonia sp. LMG 32965]
MHEVFQTRAQVREQGAEAYRRGKAESDCPYQEHTCAHREWVVGFRAARDGVVRVAEAA